MPELTQLQRAFILQERNRIDYFKVKVINLQRICDVGVGIFIGIVIGLLIAVSSNEILKAFVFNGITAP